MSGDSVLWLLGGFAVSWFYYGARYCWAQRPVVMWDDVQLRYRAARRISAERGLP